MRFRQSFCLLAILTAISQAAVSISPAVAAEEVVLTQESETSASSFQDELAAFTKNNAYLERMDAGLHVIRLDDGKEMFSYQKEEKLMPASTMKIVTGAAALKTLGPSYRYPTEMYVDGKVDASGALDGNLYVKGYGDPTMVVEKLWKFVQELKFLGIESIQGDVIFDETYFDSQYQLSGWDKQEDIERGPSYFATLGALSLNFNTAAFVVGPGNEIGGNGRVLLETAADGYVELENTTVTGGAGSRRWLEVTREITENGMKFTFDGVLPEGSNTFRVYRTVADPTAHFMAAWKSMETQQGLKVKGSHLRGETPKDARLLHRTQSPPLAAILMNMNKYSNNFIAEQVLKTLGAEQTEGIGSTETGLHVINGYLKSIGVQDGDHVLINGSGLSRNSFFKPTVLTAVLKDMGKDPAVQAEFRASLSIAGLDGTLWKRMRENTGQMRGKTGTIDGVHCLVGFFQSENGTEYVYAFLMNGLRGRISRAKNLQDQMLQAMIRSSDTMAHMNGKSTDSVKP